VAVAEGMMGFLGALGLGAGILLGGFGVLGIFLARGAFKGQKWAVITSLVFAILGLISALMNIDSVGTSFIVNLAISGFMAYCSVRCMKSSYYK